MVAQYKNLVFKGGGMKSYAYTGTLEVLEKEGVLAGIEKVAGSSAGALYAALVGLNFSASEIRSFINTIDVGAEVRNASPDETLVRFFNDYGQYTGKASIDAFAKFISKKVDPNITLGELHNKHFSKDMYFAAADVSDGKSIVLSYEDTPNLKLIDAIRISCSYPLMYTPVTGVLEKGHYYVDGGLLNNYPIDFFNDESCNSEKYCKSNPETLGIFLGNHEEDSAMGLNEIGSLISNIADKFQDVDPDKLEEYMSQLDYNEITKGTDQPITNIISYLGHIFYTYYLVEYKDYNVDEILIDSNGLSALDLEITDEEKQNLVNNGITAAEDFINTHNNSDEFII